MNDPAKVLLFHPPMDLGYTILTPLGLACLHAATPPGYEVRVWDMTQGSWNDLGPEDFAPYDVIGICARYTYNERKLKTFVRDLSRRFPRKTFVAGGQHATHDVKGMIESGIRYVVRFMGEQTWADLLRALRDDLDPAGIAGLAHERDGEIRIEPDRPFVDPNALPIPSFHVFEPGAYPYVCGLYGTSLEASRGCPNRCSFCTNYAIWKGKWAPKAVPRILEEVERIQGLGFTFAFFADDNFGVDVEHMRSLFEALARRDRPLLFMTAMQPRTIARHPEILELGWRAGLRIVSLDTNTIDEETRRAYARTDDADTIRQALEALRASKVASVSNVIVGAPGETREKMKRNVRFTKRHADVFACSTLEPRPGNRYWRASDWQRTEMLGKGEPLLHEQPRMVRRLIHAALLGYYFHPRNLLRAIFSTKLGTRIVLRLHYRLYTNAALNKFFARDRTARWRGSA